MKTGAMFDATEQYRYSLWREWNPTLPKVGFVMLNPNRADATQDDPTIRRCLGFARSWDYGSLEVVNLFAYRTAHPQNLQPVVDPVGKMNDRILKTLAERVDHIVIAWGNWGTWQQRNQIVLELFREQSLYCFGLTKRGQPYHPLYLRSTLKPIEFISP